MAPHIQAINRDKYSSAYVVCCVHAPPRAPPRHAFAVTVVARVAPDGMGTGGREGDGDGSRSGSVVARLATARPRARKVQACAIVMTDKTVTVSGRQSRSSRGTEQTLRVATACLRSAHPTQPTCSSVSTSDPSTSFPGHQASLGTLLGCTRHLGKSTVYSSRQCVTFGVVGLFGV